MADSDYSSGNLNDYFIMEWVDTKEKLPTPNESVIVCIKGDGNGSVEVKYLTEQKYGYHYGWYPGGLDFEQVTHWMPLPPMPSVDKPDIKGAEIQTETAEIF